MSEKRQYKIFLDQKMFNAIVAALNLDQSELNTKILSLLASVRSAHDAAQFAQEQFNKLDLQFKALEESNG